MSLFHLFILAMIQGVTEFLPVSSSGHLALLPALTNLEDQGLALDVAVHLGTLFAVVFYFRSDVRRVLRGLPKVLRRQIDDQDAWLALCLVIATIPVILAGLIFNLTGLSDALRSMTVIGWTMLIFGLVLYWADKTGPVAKQADQWSLKDAALMGVAQVLALIPGTSRSGITITAARKLGYERRDAARLSMLMSIPTILASGTLVGAEVALTMNAGLLRDGAIAAVLSFAAALAALALMMRLLRSVSFTPYVVYRVVLGVVLLVIAYN